MVLDKEKKVNFFIVGQPKTGTTSLYHYLKKHPDIFLPNQKQLYYFASDFNDYRKKNKLLNKSYYREYYNYSFKSYIKKFNSSKEYQIYSDITPDYIYSENAAANIYKYNPNAKVIAILREPLSFLKSFHLQLVNSGKELEKDFMNAIDLEQKRKIKRFNQDLHTPDIFFHYKELINYKYFLDKYLKLFKCNFKIILYEDFKNDNINILNKILEFLSLELIEFDKIITENKSYKKSLKLTALKKKYFMRIISSKIPNQFKYYIKGLLDQVSFKSSLNTIPSLSDKEINIKIKFKKQVIDLENYINKNQLLLLNNNVDLLKKWSYK